VFVSRKIFYRKTNQCKIFYSQPLNLVHLLKNIFNLCGFVKYFKNSNPLTISFNYFKHHHDHLTTTSFFTTTMTTSITIPSSSTTTTTTSTSMTTYFLTTTTTTSPPPPPPLLPPPPHLGP